MKHSDCEKNEIAKHCWEAGLNFTWDQENVVDKKIRLIYKKIKEIIHFLRSHNHMNKISNMFPEI